MPRATEKLTPLFVRRAPPGNHHDGAGLYLQVDDKGNRSWLFRYGAQGKHWHGLGPLHTVTLAEARDKARSCRQLLLDGQDPIAVARARKATALIEAGRAITFKQASEKCIDSHAEAWSSKNTEQWKRSLARYAYPVLGSLPVASIDTGLVMRVIEPLWRAKSETADRVRMRIERVLGWASAHGYRNGDNPARWRGHLDALLPAVGKIAPTEHLPALPYARVRTLMKRLRKGGAVSDMALEFLILAAGGTDGRSP